MKTVFMGTPSFACPFLEALLEKEEVVAVVTQPDRPSGRGRKFSQSPVKEMAIRNGLRVLQPESVKNEGFFSELKNLCPDLIVVVAFGEILQKRILDIPKWGAINVHASLLPKYRGAAPIQWAIINGDEVTGISIIRMDEGMDTGEILHLQEVPIQPDETAGELEDRISIIGAKCLIKTLRDIEEGKAILKPQDHSLATYAPKLKKGDGEIDWRHSAKDIRNRIRGMNPWPVAFTFLDGKLLRIFKAKIVNSETKGNPGEVIEAKGDNLFIQTGDGVLLLQEVQLEGRKRMAVSEFLRGYCLKKGTILGKLQ
jgi:methionyl-tRNA formyltransferase